jgi:phosphoribosyl 1,2-cyclic phosphodiesterase
VQPYEGARLKITFYGVRGSTPCSTQSTSGFGGHTSCVVVEPQGSEPIILDLGTGLRCWGESQPHDGSFKATALVTHFHFDHVQGLPFLSCADRVGSQLTIYGPAEDSQSVKEMFTEFVRPPFFPVKLSDLRGTYACFDVLDDVFAVDQAKVTAKPVPHVGATLGYRIEADGISIAYLPDHQAPLDLHSIDPRVRELVSNVDLLIHDAQYNATDWETKAHWGHSTYDYAMHVARECEVRALALFHHDPSRSDADLAEELAQLQPTASAAGIEVFAAAEKLQVNFERDAGGSLSLLRSGV